MARRGGSRKTERGYREPPVVAQANPTPEQRARSVYVVENTIDPYGETIVQGKAKPHNVCVRQPVYKRLRKGICRDTIKVLDWYADRHALASKGYTKSCLDTDGIGGGGRQVIPIVETRAAARRDCDWAKAQIRDAHCLLVFVAVMEQERTFTELGGGNSDHEAIMVKAFAIAANRLLLGIGGHVLPY